MKAWQRICCIAVLLCLCGQTITLGAGDVSLGIHATTIAPMDGSTTRLELENYQDTDGDRQYTLQSTRALDTFVHTLSNDAVLTFSSDYYFYSVTLACLTDLNGDGVYEWVDGDDETSTRLRSVLTASETISQTRNLTNFYPDDGDITISAATLVNWGQAQERRRLTGGETVLTSLTPAVGGDRIYYITVNRTVPKTRVEAESLYFFFRIDNSFDSTRSLREVGAAAFSDLAIWNPYWEDIDFCVRNGLLNGTGAGTFSPSSAIDRATLVQLLYNHSGTRETRPSTFSDVPNGKWYTNSVAWASSIGIVGGFGNGTFRPLEQLTREQLAVILKNYAATASIRLKDGDTAALSAYADGGAVSAWAKDAMAWAVANDILPLSGQGSLAPSGTVSRTELAYALHQMIAAG